MVYHSYKSNDTTKLIHSYYELSFTNNCIPYQTTILPITMPSISYVHEGEHIIKNNTKEYILKNLIISGQTLSAFKLKINTISKSSGIVLHPTTLYKILGKDVSIYTNKHVIINDFLLAFSKQLKDVFKSNTKENALKTLEDLLKNHAKHINKDTAYIDNAIDLIKQKEGLLSTKDLLSIFPVSQKTLETKFKEIVGETPGKYIKLVRFVNLMKKYECDEIAIKDLIFRYNYYDESHFAKDFKNYTHESQKEYLKKDNYFAKKYLNI